MSSKSENAKGRKRASQQRADNSKPSPNGDQSWSASARRQPVWNSVVNANWTVALPLWLLSQNAETTTEQQFASSAWRPRLQCHRAATTTDQRHIITRSSSHTRSRSSSVRFAACTFSTASSCWHAWTHAATEVLRDCSCCYYSYYRWWSAGYMWLRTACLIVVSLEGVLFILLLRIKFLVAAAYYTRLLLSLSFLCCCYCCYSLLFVYLLARVYVCSVRNAALIASL